MMNIKKTLREHFKSLCVAGVISSWVTVGSLYTDCKAFSFISFFITSVLIALAVVVEKI